MDRGSISQSAVKLAEAAAVTDDPWYGQQLAELAHELGQRARLVLEAAQPMPRRRDALSIPTRSWPQARALTRLGCWAKTVAGLLREAWRIGRGRVPLHAR